MFSRIRQFFLHEAQQIKQSDQRRLRASIVLTGLAWGYWYGIHHRFYECVGDSMYPTMSALGLVVDTESLRDYRELHIGDLVVLRNPSTPGSTAIKRIVGLPGDSVPDPLAKSGRTVVPYGFIWVVGDNEKSALDSRYWGPISQNLVARRVTRIVWPLSQFGPINPPPAYIVSKYNLDRTA